MKYFTKLVVTFFLIIFTSIALAENFSDRIEVKQFIEDMHNKHKLNKDRLNNIFSKFTVSDDVIARISKPYESLDWGRYRKLFLNKERIKKGVKFWQDNKDALASVEKKYKVPAEIIIAIIGIETYYGENKGSFPVIQSLATLAFDYPKRSEFFKKELEQFLLLCKEHNLDPVETKGSYAGAMGIPQFISSSYRRFAVGFGDQKFADIINNTDSAIASVANYLRKNGWQNNETKVNQAIISGKKYKSFISTKLTKPQYSLENLNKNGILSSKNLKKSDKLSLIELDTGNNREYWLTDNNFYVITTYNRSYNYAMAVYQLSQEIKKLKQNDA